jgi:hypothetical protein
MKTRSKPLDQHLYHEIEDEERVQAYLDDALPLVGKVVMNFNGLESGLNIMLCEHITDRSDSIGLLVLHKMTFGAKVDLFKRFSDDFQRTCGIQINSYPNLVANLREAARMRNLVVHADWESTEDDGYTFVSLRITESDIEQQYIQLSRDSLLDILSKIDSTRDQLDAYWEERGDALANVGRA